MVIDFHIHILTVSDTCKLPIVSKGAGIASGSGEGKGAHVSMRSGDFVAEVVR